MPKPGPFSWRLAAPLMLALLAAGCSREAAEAEAQRPAPQVRVQTVQPRDIPFTLSFVAQTESSRQVNIVARVSGFLDQIAYQEGEVVRAGQLMFQLDPKPFQAQLEAARGALQSQQARFATAQANLARVKPLAEQNALSQSDLDRAQGEHDAAKAAVYSAQASLTQAELNLGYATIRSPLNGVAGRALQRQGAYVNSMSESANLTYVAAVDPIWVTFSISQNQAARWADERKRGTVVAPKNQAYEVDLVLPDGTPFPQRGRISFADPSFSADTGSFMVRAVLPNPNLELRPGMFVTAFLRGAIRPNAIVVPQLAVQQGSNGHFVYVVNAAGAAELRPVIVGDYFGEKEIVVASGLHGGDQVVVEGVLKVVPGQPVQVLPAAAPASAPASAAAPA
ncbi:MAG: efflux RND transporter periplasmic adaptor subunit, partial [Burkholderiales bacterium]|nr:efflux RND transporter periplasmic adaptor subunit [Burkholderiales bacterium]